MAAKDGSGGKQRDQAVLCHPPVAWCSAVPTAAPRHGAGVRGSAPDPDQAVATTFSWPGSKGKGPFRYPPFTAVSWDQPGPRKAPLGGSPPAHRQQSRWEAAAGKIRRQALPQGACPSPVCTAGPAEVGQELYSACMLVTKLNVWTQSPKCTHPSLAGHSKVWCLHGQPQL